MRLEEIRDEIDKTDEALLALFLRRMELGRLAAEEKLKLGKPLQDNERERHILNKVSEASGALSAYSERLFQELMALSRAYQGGLFAGKGQLAQKVSEALAAEKARQSADWEAVYQALLARTKPPAADFSPLQVIKKPEQLENALLLTASLARLPLCGKRVLVLTENGAEGLFPVFSSREAGKLTAYLPADSGAALPEETEILINTDPALSRKGFSGKKLPESCFAVFDLCSLLHRSPLLMEAQERGQKTADGLVLLALSLAQKQGLVQPSAEQLRALLVKLRRERGNLVIIGMPGSGKSTVAELISRKTGRRFVNLDSEIVLRSGKSIPAIFAEEGEQGFRALERELVLSAGAMTGAVIATGGGTIKDDRNYAPLHSNGRIYYLRRALEELETEGRPLSKNLENLRRLEIEREPLYCRFADAEIRNDMSLAEAAEGIWEEYNEYFSH